MSVTIMVWVLFLSAGLALALAVFAFRRRKDRAAQALVIYQVGIAVICVAYAFELMSMDLAAKTIWVQIRYGGWLLQLIALPYFVFWYLRAQSLVPSFMVTIFIGVPVFFFLALLTNPFHHAYYSSLWLDTSGDFPMFAKTNGPLYWLYQLYAVLLHIGLVIVLLRGSTWVKQMYRSQAISLVIALLLPLLTEVSYLLGFRPSPYLNLTPFSYLTTGLVFSWMLYYFRGLELRPIALDLTFNRIPTAILILDNTGVVTDLNHAAISLLRIGAVYRGGQRLDHVCSAWPELVEQVNMTQAGKIRQIERRQEQTRKIYSLEVVTLEHGLGEIIGQLVLIREISALVAAEEEHVEKQRALAALEERERLARELHDSLGQVVGYMNLETQNALHLIESSQTALAQATLQRMSEVVTEAQADMRELLLGMRQGFSASSDFFTALDTYIQEFSRIYAIPIGLHLPSLSKPPVLAPGVEVHLLRLIQEALSNARKHAHANHVEIFFNFSQSELRVAIEDDGCGFDLSVPKPDDDGLHFGLSIMHERAAEMKGQLQLISAPGRGTRVMITVPYAPTPAGVGLPKISGWRVLIADDHPLFRDGLKNLLIARGIQVVAVVKDGAEAVEKARELQPDIAILDIHMPIKNGVEAASEIKQQTPQTRILMLTMVADDDTLIKAFRAGASGYLLKDLKAEDFLVRLDALMNGETLIPAGMAEKLLRDRVSRSDVPVDQLNERQVEILRLIAQRLTYAQIAERLNLSESTIKYHTAQIMDKLGVSGREEALAEAANRGLIERRRPGR